MQSKELSQIESLLNSQGYITERKIAMSVFLSMQLNKPLLVEGPAGVGKTEIAKVMSRALEAKLIRLQCYEGLDAYQAIYEWNYQRQLLHLKMEETSHKSIEEKENSIFSDHFLLKRPLLEAISQDIPTVLLIDEVDRADEAFESFLLEILSDWQITIPEIGTIKAQVIPKVVITSNSVRELSEALRRRCLYLWIDYPDFEKEMAIINRKVPGIDEKLAEQITLFMQELRKQKLEKIPGVAESMDWARALAALHLSNLDRSVVEDTLGIILKDWQDIRNTQDSLSELLEKVGVTSRFDF